MRNRFTAASALALALALGGCTAPSIMPDDASQQASADPADEVARLLAQPYIDPLTDYLQAHAEDPSRRAAVEQIQAERTARCDAVAVRYETRDTTRIWLNRLRKGYAYSCPDLVETFGAKVEASADQGPDAQPADEAVECIAAFEGQNYADAVDLCRPLAEHGEPGPQWVLGRLYSEGLGVIRNPQEAFVWFSLAEYGGHPEAAGHRRETSRLLGEEQIFEAEERMLKISERYPD